MPPKIRELEAQLEQAGFVRLEGKGSHRKWIHPDFPHVKIVMSGKSGDDADRYQIKEISEALQHVGYRQEGRR